MSETPESYLNRFYSKYYLQIVGFRKAIKLNSISQLKNHLSLIPVEDRQYFLNDLNTGKVGLLTLSFNYDKTTDKDIVNFLLLSGCNPNFPFLNGSTNLIFSLFYDSSNIGDLLLKYGANIYTRDSEGKSVLDHAIFLNNIDMIKKIKRRIRKDKWKLRKVLFNSCLSLNEDCFNNIVSFIY